MVRFGILGPGQIARRFASDIQLVSNAELVAVASRSLEKAEKFKEEFGAQIAYDSYEKLAQSDLIDAVYIATPHNFHLEQAKLMIRNGKHVLIEKPITVNSRGLEEVLYLAKKYKVLVMEAFWTRFLPSTNRVKEIIEKKDLGKLNQVEFNFGIELPVDYPEIGRMLNPKLAGGSILDLGIYPVSTTRFFDQSDIVSMDVDAHLSELGVDLDMSCTIEFSSGLIAHLRSSFSQELDMNGLLEFENGYIIMKDFFHSQQLIVNGQKVDIPFRGHGFVDEIESFTNTVLSGQLENEVMTYKVMRDVMQLLDTIRSKAKVYYEFEKRESDD
jgi:predicted dehydrogenase